MRQPQKQSATMQSAKRDMDDLRHSLPPAGELVARGVQVAVAAAQLLLAHTSLNRIGTVLGLEGELKRDGRVAKDGGLGGALGTVQHIYRTSGPLGLLRGLAPHALYFAGAMGVQRVLHGTTLGRMLLPYIDSSASKPLTITRLALLPLASGLLFWPARALRNAIQSNYTADIGGASKSTATTTPSPTTTTAQQQPGHNYDNFVEAIGAVLRRVGWKGLLLHSGWEAYVLKQYVFHALFVAPSVLSRLWGSSGRAELERMQQSTPMAAGRMLLYGLLSYPLVNVMLRMALLPSSGDASRYTSVLQCVREVAAREGWTGLYSGFGFSMVSYLLLMVLRTAGLDISGWKPISRMLHH